MNCLPCALTRPQDPPPSAVAVCGCCGAGVCLEHAAILTCPAQPAGLVTSRAAMRRIRCTTCQSAQPAVHTAAGARGRRTAPAARR